MTRTPTPPAGVAPARPPRTTTPATALDLSLPELRLWMRERGVPAYRADQLWRALYAGRVAGPGEVRTLPGALRERLARELPMPVLEPVRAWEADGGATRKWLLRLHDGRAIECVLMRYEDGRATACVSSQAGCALGCVFCATGMGGFDRNLSAGEIAGQALHVVRELRASGARLTNVVYMGMGEPLANLAAVRRSVENLHEPLGLDLGARRITISTVGLVPGIRELAAWPLAVNLAVSLHAADDETRSRLMPVNRRWPLAELLAAVREYIARTGRRVSFEYALIGGENASVERARALGALLRGLLCHVNLIPLNRVPGSPLAPPSHAEVRAFRREVEAAGVPCTVRVERGSEILAACGQLRVEHAGAS